MVTLVETILEYTILASSNPGAFKPNYWYISLDLKVYFIKNVYLDGCPPFVLAYFVVSDCQKYKHAILFYRRDSNLCKASPTVCLLISTI